MISTEHGPSQRMSLLFNAWTREIGSLRIENFRERKAATTSEGQVTCEKDREKS